MIQIYRNGEVLHSIEIESNSQLTRKQGVSDFVTINIKSTDYLDLQINDYVDINGIISDKNGIYKLRDIPKCVETPGMYEYSCIFYGSFHLFQDAIFLLTNTNYFNFPFTGLATDFITLLVENLNSQLGLYYEVGSIDSTLTEYKTIDFNNVDCFVALTQIIQEFETNFYIIDNTINLGTPSNLINESIPFKVGVYDSLYSLTRQSNNNVNIVTKLFGYGSTENLPSDYESQVSPKRLCFENDIDTKSYLLQNNEIYGNRTQIKIFEDIKPERQGSVTTLGASEFEFYDSAIDFDINDYLIEGVVAKLEVLTGNLVGLSFDFEFDFTTKLFTVAEITNDTGTFPNTTQKFSISDTYTVTGISMPQSYIDNAIELLKEATNNELVNLSKPNTLYNLSLSENYIIENNLNIELNDTFSVYDEYFDTYLLVNVQAFTQNLLRQTEYNLTISNITSNSLTEKINKETTKLNLQKADKQEIEKISSFEVVDDKIILKVKQKNGTKEVIYEVPTDDIGNPIFSVSLFLTKNTHTLGYSMYLNPPDIPEETISIEINTSTWTEVGRFIQAPEIAADGIVAIGQGSVFLDANVSGGGTSQRGEVRVRVGFLDNTTFTEKWITVAVEYTSTRSSQNVIYQVLEEYNYLAGWFTYCIIEARSINTVGQNADTFNLYVNSVNHSSLNLPLTSVFFNRNFLSIYGLNKPLKNIDWNAQELQNVRIPEITGASSIKTTTSNGSNAFVIKDSNDTTNFYIKDNGAMYAPSIADSTGDDRFYINSNVHLRSNHLKFSGINSGNNASLDIYSIDGYSGTFEAPRYLYWNVWGSTYMTAGDIIRTASSEDTNYGIKINQHLAVSTIAAVGVTSGTEGRDIYLKGGRIIGNSTNTFIGGAVHIRGAYTKCKVVSGTAIGGSVYIDAGVTDGVGTLIEGKVLIATTNSGYVGIGATTLTDKLTLTGNFALNGILKNKGYTQTEIDAMSPAAGWELYNSTTNKKQVYNGTIWNDLY